MACDFSPICRILLLAAAICAIRVCSASASAVPVLRARLVQLRARQEAMNVNIELSRYQMETAQELMNRYKDLVEREQRGDTVPFREVVLAAKDAFEAQRKAAKERRLTRKALGEYLEQVRGLQAGLTRHQNLPIRFRQQAETELEQAKEMQKLYIRTFDSDELRGGPPPR
uniref:Uncharacterized protein n=1 Tax=Neospora caninum (strain Liverpool) TaxID=572307 RepID=A0A0F7U7G3_NEOCL|nr:TPA: hypothetical protein BN1204_002495 [Neospora caninum Liverpool]